MVRMALLLIPGASAQELFLAPSFISVADGQCTAYRQDSDNCDDDCGRCFNKGGRAGVLCKG